MGMKAKWGKQDWEARLNGGVVLWANQPYRIRWDGEHLSLLDLVTGRVFARDIEPEAPELDVSSVRLGFVNTEEGAIYLQRSPMRRYKQAVDDRSITESRLTAAGFVHGPEGRSSYLYSQSFRDTFTKAWPDYRHAVSILNRGDIPSVALTSEIAVTIDGLGIVKVWYKFEQVGYITPENPTVVCVPNSEKAWVISAFLSELTWTIN